VTPGFSPAELRGHHDVSKGRAPLDGEAARAEVAHFESVAGHRLLRDKVREHVASHQTRLCRYRCATSADRRRRGFFRIHSRISQSTLHAQDGTRVACAFAT
jgi:hypothetical protein